MSYTCETCAKVFSTKRQYTFHRARKTPCVAASPLEQKEETEKTEETVQPPLLPSAALLTPPLISETHSAPLLPSAALLAPPLKWVGGKTQLLPSVLARFPTDIRDYYEPFLGGGSVLLALLSQTRIRITGTVYASDINPHLIGFYQHLQSRLPELWEALQGILEEQKTSGMSDEEFYYAQRTRFNALDRDAPTPAASALFLYLNKTCFRGVYREGPRGFNVPFGHYKNPTIATYPHLRAVSDAIQGVRFRVCRFQVALAEASFGAEDFVYLDPPYAPEKRDSFTAYVAGGFPAEQHESLFDACQTLKGEGVRLLLSNADVPWVRESLPASQGWVYESLSCRRAIHSKRPDSRAMEVLVSSF